MGQGTAVGTDGNAANNPINLQDNVISGRVEERVWLYPAWPAGTGKLTPAEPGRRRQAGPLLAPRP